MLLYRKGCLRETQRKMLWLSFVNPGKGRSSPSEMFFKIGVLKNLRSFTGKLLCCCLFLMELQEISEIFKNTFFIKHLQWLPLDGFCEGTSLVKILQSCHLNIFRTITDASERWMNNRDCWNIYRFSCSITI